MNNSKSLIVPIIYPSAKDFWLSKTPDLMRYSLDHRKLVSLPNSYDLSIHTAEAKEIATMLGLPLPLTLCGKEDCEKRHNKNIIIKRQKQSFPPNSFIAFKINKYLFYIASPELCFIQSQRYLGEIESIRFGSNLCSIFRQAPDAEYNQTKREPLTTQSQITDFLKLLSSYPGVKSARHTSHYVIEKSNSPVETALGILFALPINLGGYGIGRPQMNYTLNLSGIAQKLLNYNSLRVDFAWPNRKFAIEYNSNLVHTNPNQISTDSNRMTAITHCGFQAMSITAQNIKDFRSLEKIMLAVRHAMKLPDSNYLLNKYQAKRLHNASVLFQWGQI